MNYNINILKALADETRVNIILVLKEGEKSVSEVVSKVNKSQPNVSIALKKLENVGLISQNRDKKNVFYKIKNKELVDKILNLIKKWISLLKKEDLES